VTHDVEFLWFSDCPNQATARQMLEDIIAELAPGTPIRDLDATDPLTAERLRFPGSPTIRLHPEMPAYRTESGLRGLPERRWIEDALRSGHERAAPTDALVSMTGGRNERG
jgi:hypothetical protein